MEALSIFIFSCSSNIWLFIDFFYWYVNLLDAIDSHVASWSYQRLTQYQSFEKLSIVKWTYMRLWLFVVTSVATETLGPIKTDALTLFWNIESLLVLETNLVK